MKKKFLLILLFILIPVTIFLAWLGISTLSDRFTSPIDLLKQEFRSETVSKHEMFKNADSWIYDLSFENSKDVKKIVDSNADVVVVDKSDVTKEVVERMKGDKEKLVLCYMSLGQAETYREYWQKAWDKKLPDWIVKSDDNLEDSYNIKFWEEEWEKIISDYLDEIIDMGFDGVYMDDAGLSFWSDMRKKTDAEDLMIALIEDIYEQKKQKNEDFLMLLQNVGFWQKDQSEILQNYIDGVGQEEVYWGYENKDGVNTPNKITNEVVALLTKYQDKGMKVFVIDYPFKCKNGSFCYSTDNLKRLQDLYSRAREDGFIPYAQGRNATGVPAILPQVSDVKVEYENLPIFSWDAKFYNGENKKGHRIFVSSTKDKIINDIPDVYDSGRIWGENEAFGFIPDKKLKAGEYYWKVVLYEEIDEEEIIVSAWSEVEELDQSRGNDPTEGQGQSPEPTGEDYQTGWIPDWDFDNGFESLKESSNKFGSISPVWFSLKEKGQLEEADAAKKDEFSKFCTSNNIKLIPSIPAFDVDVLSNILEDNLDSHVDAIYKAVTEGNYDGIDIDYEITYLKDRELFFEFLTKLAGKLHKDGKILSVTVLSKWSDSDIYAGLSQTRKVQDWERIGELADEVRIMAYDWTWQTVYKPGPISPIYWEELILQYAVKKLPKEKIVLALPLYAYSFRIDEKSKISDDIYTGGEISGTERRVLAYTYDDILALKKKHKMKLTIDKYSQEKIYSYKFEKYKRAMYFSDGEMIKKRRELAKEYGIKGVAYWRLGGEDERGFD